MASHESECKLCMATAICISRKCGHSFCTLAPEFAEKRVMRQKSDVFGVIVSFVLTLSLLLWFSGMDAFENA